MRLTLSTWCHAGGLTRGARAALASALLLGLPLLAGAAPLRFFVLGDTPYSDGQRLQVASLLADVAEQRPPFVIHVGDIKAGSQPCTDEGNVRIADLFRVQPFPVLYTPGDNEWTDCHRPTAGARDPLERLAALRETFWTDPRVLHTKGLGVRVSDPSFPENLWFVRDGVVIALVHVVGSNNNAGSNDPAAIAELQARSAANRALLREATAEAVRGGSRAVVLAFHGNPLFESAHPAKGFEPLRADLRQLLRDYPGPVLVIHGDTHHFRLDNPPLGPDSAESGERLWRLEVPGAPTVAGVWVSVDAEAPRPFAVQTQYPDVIDVMALD